MEKRDFYKGRIVWLYSIRNAARSKKTTEERIEAFEVTAVGRKYITVRNNYHVLKFDMTNDFKQISYGSPDYLLFLYKDDIFDMLHKNEMIADIRNACKWGSSILNNLSTNDLEIIDDILKKNKK